MENLGLSQSLQVLSYQEGFYAYIKLCLMTAIFMAYPIIVYQIWKFVEAGLYKRERRYVKNFCSDLLHSIHNRCIIWVFFINTFWSSILDKDTGRRYTAYYYYESIYISCHSINTCFRYCVSASPYNVIHIQNWNT